jgi:hypothetical protein
MLAASQPFRSGPPTEAAGVGHGKEVRLAIGTGVLAAMAVGCVQGPAIDVEAPGEGSAAPAVALLERQITVAPDEAPPAATARTEASPRRLAPDPVAFQLGAGYGALSRVDLDACRERGLQAGYLRVHATFTGYGYVVRASVEGETAPSPAALDCIADQLRQAGVPAFDGGEARLTRTYYVERAPGATGAD